MPGVDQRELRIAADAYRAARREYHAATEATGAAYERLQGSPETLEYKTDWFHTRRHEAEVARRLRQAEERYREAGGYLFDSDE